MKDPLCKQLLIQDGHRAYNDMLYLCEKYGASDTLEKYDPEKDISVAGAYVPLIMK